MNQFPAHLSSLVCGQREAEPQAKAGGHGEISPRRAAVSALDYGCGGAADLTGNNSLLRGPDAPPHPLPSFYPPEETRFLLAVWLPGVTSRSRWYQ